MNEKEIFQKALDTYGETRQILMMLEEMAELQVVLLNLLRQRDPRELCRRQIVEELADVTIMVGQMRLLYCRDGELEDEMRHKLERLSVRIAASRMRLGMSDG